MSDTQPKKIHEKAVIANPKQLDDFIARVKKTWDGRKAVKVEIKTVSSTRSLEQSSLFHLWRDQIMDFWNDHRPPGCAYSYDKDWVKNRLKQQFGEKMTIVDPITGNEKTYLKSTADYTRGEMYFFMTAIQNWALEKYDLVLDSIGEFAEIQQNDGQIPDGE